MKERLLLFALLASVSLPALLAQTPLDQAITSRFPVTKATADRTDIVTAGAVMTLRKDGIIMFATTASTKANLLYKDGKVSPTLTTRMAAFSLTGKIATNIVQRTYVAGEKLWLIDVKDESDGVVLQLLSDAVNDVRYTASIKFPFPKGPSPRPEAAVSQIAQVISPEGGAAPAPPAEPAPPAPPVALPPIAPPPPPPDQAATPPPTLEKGQKRDDVLAAFGQPKKVVKVGSTKEIDYYQDMKVTYVNGKVTNVE